MKKLLNSLKNDRGTQLTLLVMLVVFILTLIQNFWTRYLADDWCYMYVYDHMGHPNDTSRRVNGLFDVIISMKNHWRICNGRVVAHGLLQLVLATSYPGFHKVIFNIVNSIMYVLLGWLLYKHSVYGRKKSIFLLIGIYAMMWLWLPQYGATVLWASGAANYLWCAVIILAYLLPYRKYAADSTSGMKDTTKNAVIMGVLGLFAGCTNENSGGAAALICILFVIVYKICKIKIPKWSISGIAGLIIGAVVLISAPGNYRISSKADLAEYINRLKDVINTSGNLLFGLLITFMVVMLLVWITNQGDEQRLGIAEKLIPAVYIIGAAAAIGVMMFAALRPERTWFISICIIIAVIGYMFTQINMKNIGGAIPYAAAVLIIICAASYTTELKKLHQTYTQIQAQDEAIAEARESDDKIAEVKLIVPSDSPHDSMFYTGNFSTNGDEWDNSWAARYYGLNKIIGIEP